VAAFNPQECLARLAVRIKIFGLQIEKVDQSEASCD
jgi:hypothetical protein